MSLNKTITNGLELTSSGVGIATSGVTLARMANLAAGTAIGRQIDAGTGAPVALTGTEIGSLTRRYWWETTDTASSGTVADYVLTDKQVQIHFNVSAAVTIQSFTASNGRTLEIALESTSSPVTLENQSAGGTLTKIRTPSAKDLVLYGGDGCTLTLFNGRYRVTAISRLIRHDSLASIASTGESVPFTKYVAFTATGATGTLIDVTIWNASAPFALRILGAELRVSVAAGTTSALRTASGGGGSVVLPDAAVGTQTFLTATTGRQFDAAAATATVAAAGSLFFNVDRAVTGEIMLTCVRT